MTTREMFAMNAPPMPDWFINKSGSKYTAPKRPAISDYVHADVNPHADDDAKLIQQWIEDAMFDLPEHLEAFGRAWVEYKDKCEIFTNARFTENIVAWRWFYADEMMLAGKSRNGE